MEELDFEQKVELRSEEVQEIMGQIPSWIQRWGLTIIFMLLVVFFIICYILKFPQTLTSEIILTSITPPVELHAHATGKFAYVKATDKQIVKQGSILAIIQNTANFQDIEYFKSIYLKWKRNEISLEKLLELLNSRKWQMGELQSYFIEFWKNVENYHNYKNRNYYPQKLALKKEEQNWYKEMKEQWEQEVNLISEQITLARKFFIRDSILFSKRIGTEEQYEQSRNSYIQSQHIIHNNYRQRIEIALREIEEQNNYLELQHECDETTRIQEQTLFIASEQLEAQFNLWEQTYVLRSPIDGIVNLMGIWSENQYVTEGELVFIIQPRVVAPPLGKVWLPASGIGKVKVGQDVYVRLNNYPSSEYGFLNGRVLSVSEIPNENHLYYVNIEFPNGLKTNYNRQLPQSKQMTGIVQIIIEEKRLIEKIIGPFVDIFNSFNKNGT